MTLVSLDSPADHSLAASTSSRRTGSVWARAETVFLLVTLIMGWSMAFLTPPFQVPDEPAHLYRVWQLAHGVLLSVNHYYTVIPVEFNHLQVERESVTFHPYPTIPYRDMFKRLTGPPPGSKTLLTDIDNTALYSPVAYWPQIIGVFAAIQLKWSVLGIIYAGRVASVIGYGLIGWWAIRVTPVLKWAACVTLSAPMATFLAASLSADPMTTAFCYLATAYCLRLILAGGPVPRRVVVALAFSLIAVALCKSAYYPIVLLLFAVPRRNWSMRRWWVEPVTIVLISLTVLLVWSALTKPLGVHEAGGDPAVQFHHVIYHPGKFLSNVIRTLGIQNYVLYITGIGVMGWMDTYMPVSWVNIYTAAVLWLVLTYDEPRAIPWLPRLAAAAALCASVLLVVLANYLVWTPTASPTTLGLQGRYLLPLVMLFFVIVQRPGRYRVSPLWIALATTWCLVLADWCIFARFYVM